MHVEGSEHPWGYLARLRLRPGVVAPSHWTAPLVIRITAQASRGEVGALCVADDLLTVLSNSVLWAEDDGEITLTLVVYTYPGEGWLVFRNTALASPETRCHVSAIEVLAVDHALPAVDASACPGRALIYTAITNHYDTLKPPRSPEAGCDYVCFTDDPESVPAPWNAVRIPRKSGNPRIDALWYRVHPHLVLGDHDVSLYMDGRFELRQPVLPLVRQLGRYREAGLPRHLASLLPGLLLRRHHAPDSVRLMEGWWEEIRRGSFRDQLSFTYEIWRQRVVFRRVWLPVHDNPYVRLGEHNFVDYYRR